MTEEFNEERARNFTVDCLHATARTLQVNRDLCCQIVMDTLGAPDEAMADAFLARTVVLLGIVAGKVQTGQLMDAMKKPTATSKEVH